MDGCHAIGVGDAWTQAADDSGLTGLVAICAAARFLESHCVDRGSSGASWLPGYTQLILPEGQDRDDEFVALYIKQARLARAMHPSSWYGGLCSCSYVAGYYAVGVGGCFCRCAGAAGGGGGGGGGGGSGG